MIDYENTDEHELRCRLAGCVHPAVYPTGIGWCALCRRVAFRPEELAGDPAFGYWLAGLADGEGCFWVHRQKRGAYYAPQFKIKLRADDRPTLAFCQSVLGIGNLYEHAATTANGRNNNPSCSWVVQSAADVDKLAVFFQRFPLRSKKARDLAIWIRAIECVRSIPRGNRWHGPKDWTPLLAIKNELEAVRRYK